TANDLAIIGAGADVTTINGASLDRVLDIKDATAITLADLAVADGAAPTIPPGIPIETYLPYRGGGIRTRNSQASVYQVTMSGSTAANGGGLAVLAGSDVDILRSRATGNQGIGIYVDDTSATTLLDSRIDNNSLGGIISNGTLLVSDSVIHENRYNGGIRATHEATIENSLILGNIADTLGGGLFLDGNADDPGNFVLRGSSVYENTGWYQGGGLYIAGSTLIDNTTIARNVSRSDGGGIHAATEHSILSNVSN
ncbi:MAG: right-handed parallel beta-helix repeat-containing protein, partial [Planctomycetaceae bacterium]|nr:right-handed parallel beta-helix repeat-containing protein [Planctomycetaceae bacterium]